ncbi:MAG TPA: ABC transporter permease [Burkholderiales bacterium]|nr:ABC transporter permease [Burkholderiales bacterium]
MSGASRQHEEQLLNNVGERVPGFAVLAALLVLWELSVRLEWVVTPTWPAVSTVLLTFWHACVDGTYLEVFGSSLRRLAIGYLIATACAVAIGVAMGVWRRVFLLFEPLVELLRPIPSPAYLPMAILFLGIDDGMKVFMVAFASFFPILLNTVSGVRSVDPVLVDTGRTFGLRRLQIIRRIVLPAAAGYVFTGMRISLAIALIVTVIAEMVAGNSGIGFYILNAQRSFLVPEMYAGVIALALLGFALNKGFVALERYALTWHEGWNAATT